jgi:hypothetical protein
MSESQSTNDFIVMCPKESLRKLNQLQLTMSMNTAERQVDVESLAQSDLQYLNQTQFDHTELIPFIVSAIQGLDKRIAQLEESSK